MEFNNEHNDVDSDEGETASGVSPHFNSSSKAQRRAHHNALERKRRDHIKDSFRSLRQVLPNLRGEKSASRAQILTKAIEFTTFMSRKVLLDRQANELKKQRNDMLRAKIRILEEAHATGIYTDEVMEILDAPSDNEDKSTRLESNIPEENFGEQQIEEDIVESESSVEEEEEEEDEEEEEEEEEDDEEEEEEDDEEL